MKKLNRAEVVRRCLNSTRLGFDLKLTAQEVEDLLDSDAIRFDHYSPTYEQHNIFALFDFEVRGHEGSLNVNLIYDEQAKDWVIFFDGSGPDDEFFDLDPATDKYVIKSW